MSEEHGTSPASGAAPAAKDGAAPSASLLDIASRDLKRLNAIFTIIARHGFGELFMRTPLGRRFFPASLNEAGVSPTESAAVRFRRLLEQLGPTYIKFGQILSMRRDVLPSAYIAALEGLQDNTPVVPFEQIRAVIRTGLGESIEELFHSFEEAPLATASIAQTHRAVTKDGDQVVVKVQRPGIEQTMRGDLDLLFILAKMLEASIEEMQLMAPAEMVTEFEKALLRELNFGEELQNLIVARNFVAPERQVSVPKPYPELSSRTVLTMEFFPGKSLRKVAPQSAQAKHAVAEIVQCACKQVMIDGFFHADPHAGNILINDSGQLCLIDFGLVGHLTPAQRADIVTLIIAVVTRDASTIARILLHMGTPLERVNIAELKDLIRQILDEHLSTNNLSDVDTRKIADAFITGAQQFKIKLASDYALLIKATMTVEGLARYLDPDVDLFALFRPFGEEILSKRFSPKSLLTESLSGVGDVTALLRRLPSLLEQMLHDAETGQIQIRAVTPQLDDIAPMLHQIASRMALAGFATAMTLAAALLIGLSSAERPHHALIICTIGAATGAWTSLWVWHFLGRGKPLRARTLVQFFKR